MGFMEAISEEVGSSSNYCTDFIGRSLSVSFSLLKVGGGGGGGGCYLTWFRL